MRWTQSICNEKVSKKIQKANDSISRFSVRLFNSVTIEAGSQREFLRVTYRSSACTGLRTQLSPENQASVAARLEVCGWFNIVRKFASLVNERYFYI